MSCRGWQQEAALRMLMNSLDPEVAGHPQDLVNWGKNEETGWSQDQYEALVRALRDLNHDETLLAQPSIAPRVFRTRPGAPRVLIVNGGLAILARSDHLANWSRDEKSGQSTIELHRLGLITHGQIAAECWMNTGGQELLAGSYTTFAAAGRKHFSGDLAGKLIVSGGLGRMGSAQPLAATLNGAAFLGIEVDAERIKHCIRAGYCDYCVNDLDEALRILKIAVRQEQAISVGLVGNCATIIPELARRGVVPDLLTDQTSAQDPLNGYIPVGMSVEEAARLRSHAPEEYLQRAYESIGRHAAGMIALQKLGSVVFEYANNIGAAAFEHGGVKDAGDFPGLVSAYLDPLISQGYAPLRCVALSGDPVDIRRVDGLALEMFTDNAVLRRWIQGVRKHIKFQGLPARVCWMTAGEQARLGVRVNELATKGTLKAPVVLGRDHLDYPRFRESRSVNIGREEVPDEALLSAVSGAAWVSMNSTAESTGLAILADGAPETAARIDRLFIHQLAETSDK